MTNTSFDSRDFIALMRNSGFDFFTGIPCSILKHLIFHLSNLPPEEVGGIAYVPQTREDAAVGLAAGAFLAGRTPVVLMQNSGLGYCLNALTSMNLMYRIPVLLIVSWRGYGGVDAPEHIVMGEVCGQLLDTIGIPYRVIGPEHANQEAMQQRLTWARDVMKQTSKPAVLLLRKNVLS